MGNAWVFPSICHSTGKGNKTQRKAWEIGNSYFSHSMGAFLQPDSHHVIYFITWEMLRFPINLREPGKLIPILSPKYGYFFLSDSHPMVSPAPWKMHVFSHQFLVASIPDMLELKAKYVSKVEEGMDIISSKKRNTKILGKSIPYTKLFIFNNQLQKLQSYPKNFNKKHSNHGISQESVQWL